MVTRGYVQILFLRTATQVKRSLRAHLRKPQSSRVYAVTQGAASILLEDQNLSFQYTLRYVHATHKTPQLALLITRRTQCVRTEGW